MTRLVDRIGRFLSSRPPVVANARDMRRDAPVHFYSGRNGSGKSLCAVFDTIPDLEEGRKVLSTVRILDYARLRPCEDEWCWCDKENPDRHLHAHPQYEQWTTWRQLLELRGGIALADEVTGVADSSETAALPAMVANELAQLRRADVVLRLTGLNYIRANKRVREATVAITRCSGSWAQQAYHDDGRPRLHRRRRMVEWVTYNAETVPIESPTEASFDSAEEWCRSTLWVPDTDARLAYDTFDVVDQIGTVTDAGRCAFCAGRRAAIECDCPDYVERKEGRKEGRRNARRRASGEDVPPVHLPDPLPLHVAGSAHAHALGQSVGQPVGQTLPTSHG